MCSVQTHARLGAFLLTSVCVATASTSTAGAGIGVSVIVAMLASSVVPSVLENVSDLGVRPR